MSRHRPSATSTIFVPFPSLLRRPSFPLTQSFTIVLIILALATLQQQHQHSALAIPMPMPMPFRRFFFLSAANPTTLLGENSAATVPQNEQQNANVANVEAGRLAKIGHHLEDGTEKEQQQSPSSSSSSRAALRGRIPMGPFDQWKRGGGDFCGCNMGCFYHSVGQCASCCSLGL